jgi:hypothetical protein
METLEFERDRRIALEGQLQLLATRVEQQEADLQELAATRTALLEELQIKQNFINNLAHDQTNQRLREELIEAGRERDEMEARAARAEVELEQFRSEVVRLDRERE